MDVYLFHVPLADFRLRSGPDTPTGEIIAQGFQAVAQYGAAIVGAGIAAVGLLASPSAGAATVSAHVSVSGLLHAPALGAAALQAGLQAAGFLDSPAGGSPALSAGIGSTGLMDPAEFGTAEIHAPQQFTAQVARLQGAKRGRVHKKSVMEEPYVPPPMPVVETDEDDEFQIILGIL